ncbi:MAG: HlyD family efflux transporter periplasmic adaptor subunit [Candidatus Nomurabacteria bacterium]|nr:MAG: HlyD family efflux transporter periplasmic adaptor subunit [Candidatus Nomurabacteria bacterium]
MKLFSFIGRYKWYVGTVVIMAGGLYFYNQDTTDTEAVTNFYVVDTVERGEVTSGIQTTGDIVAAQKLDIDVYKQLSRIDEVNVQNGSHVEVGDVLLSFDKSDAYVDTQSARVAVAEAALALEEEQASAVTPSTQIRTKENQIAGYEKTISDATADIADAYVDFLNEDLEVVAHPDKAAVLSERTEPQLSGRYVSNIEGVYVIEVYGSGADSGFSYRLSGLETATEEVIFGKAMDIGTRGLKVTFPSGTKNGDKWIIYVPNNRIATYSEAKKDYEDTVANLRKTIADAEVSLANAKQELVDLERTDASSYRDLSVEQAETALAEARQRLSQNYDVVQERDIVAPFAGTVEGMENVVEGATPTGGTSDSISLGTLISDEFLTTFTLGASDVSKIAVGQRVKVTVTSFTSQPVFEATITQISSLPESSGVAQYEVQALLDYDRSSSEVILREGMLADIEIVEEESVDALRIPTTAITYEQGVPMVTVVDELTEQQQQQVARMGIVRTDGTPVATYDVEVETGIVGQYYTEIISGLDEGVVIVSSSLAESTDTSSAVQQAGFGPGRNSGGAPPSN